MPPLELDTERPRIALVRLSSVGDVVRVLPLLASLRRRWPDAELTWVVEPGPHGLLAGHPMVDRFVLFRRDRPLTAHVDLWRRTRRLAFDLVLDLHRYFKAGLATALLDAPVKLGFDRGRSADFNWWFTTHRLPSGPRRHVQDELFEFLDHLGVPVVRRWPLPLTAGERRRQRAEFGRLGDEPLAVHPTSSAPAKDWPLERWAELVRAARRELGMQPLLVGGRGAREERRAERLRDAAGAGAVVDAREQDLRRLLWTVSACTAFVGPDSGPLHVAAARGVPAVGIYGHTDPARHGPRGPLGRLDELVVDGFGPRPDGPTDETRPGRMERVAVDDVLGKIERARELARELRAEGRP